MATDNSIQNLSINNVVVDDITIPILNEPVSLIASGGADSALLLYILLANTTYPVHVYTCVSKLKNMRNSTTSSDVVRKCISLTNNMNVMHHTFFVNGQSDDTLFPPVRQDMAHHGINWIYTGITANPPANVADYFTENGAIDNTGKHIRNPEKQRPIFLGDNIITPFTNIDKRKIASMYDKLELRDRLFPITHSCENTSSKYNDVHCGSCWWCRERIWGFGYH
jgi:7-cyano-7-deazaguanine synthase in queuosine biosynthesis